MATIAHRLEYLAALFGMKLAQSLSPEAADRFGVAVGKLLYHAKPSRQSIAFANLKASLGNAHTDDEYREIVRRTFLTIGRTFVEFARFRALGREGVRNIVTGEGAAILEKVYAEGKGGIIVTAHFGNWELLGAWVAAMGYPMDFLVGRQSNLLVDEMLISFRREMGVGIIPLATSVRSVFKALRANHITGLVSDQHASGSDMILDFFGRPAAVAKGPALFAIRAACPLLPFLLRRERYDRHVLIPGAPIYPPSSGDEDADIRAMTQQYFTFFEDGIARYPDQWMWTHRRWKVKSSATLPATAP